MQRRFVRTGVTALVLLAATAGWADLNGPHVSLLPNEVMGVMLSADGETPVVGYPVRVWNVDRGRFIYRTVTDQNGNFYVPPLASGENYVLAGRVRVNVDVLQADEALISQRHDIIIALPRRALILGRAVFLDTIVTPLVPLVLPEPPQVVSP